MKDTILDSFATRAPDATAGIVAGKTFRARTDAETFETHRPGLLALAHRMLGDLSRAEDMVQETWIRWQGRDVDVHAPKAYLVAIARRLCLDELGSARARREESRSDHLPEQTDLSQNGMENFETLDEVSTAFLVVLQRLTAAERAVFILHDVLDVRHREIAALLGKTEAACRKLRSRALVHLAVEHRVLRTPRDEQIRLLMAFVRALNGGDQGRLFELLADLGHSAGSSASGSSLNVWRNWFRK